MRINDYIDYDNDRIYEEKTNFYIDVKNIDIFLKETIDLSICEQKKLIESLLININEQNIIDYLNEQLKKQNLNDEFQNQINMLDKLNGCYKFVYLRQLLSNNVIRNYVYDPYTFQYLKEYIKILKNKVLTINYLMEKINTKKIDDIENLIKELDITLDDEKILFTDFIRLAMPLKFNIEELIRNIKLINNLETYMYLKKSDDINIKGLSYPSDSLQLDTLLFCSGYIPLTQKQKNILQEKNSNLIKSQIKILCKK